MIVIREEKPEDIADIQTINESAFGQPNEAKLVDMLRSRKKIRFSLVALLKDRIVGHILFSPAVIESEEDTVSLVGLAPMAVYPDYQRKGVGSRLVEAGIMRCRDAGFPGIIVLGHPDYYPRFGFVPAGRYGITCEFDVPDDVFLILALKEEALKGRSGIAKYQPEFNEV